jgi:hypothetical protein
MKTQNEILTEVYSLAVSSEINSLSGGIYKRIRPTDSKLEDCVIHIISGTYGKLLQDGALYIKIFYKDINANNTFFEDSARGQILEKMLFDFSQLLFKIPGTSFYKETREFVIEPDLDTKEHYVSMKINFKVTIY